jgi:hypothetical protein
MPKGGEIGRKAHFFRLMCYVDRARADVAYALLANNGGIQLTKLQMSCSWPFRSLFLGFFFQI